MTDLSRRSALATLGGAIASRVATARPRGYLVENAIHMFPADVTRFPIHPNAPYQPKPNSLEDYIAFVKTARLDHTVLIHPEPYQDDHRYLEYCFTQEPSPGYFKGTCLFDPVDPKTPARLQALVDRNPNRIVAMRIHEVQPRGEPFTNTGAIRSRDLRSPEMRATLRQLQDLKMAAQFQLVPYFARPIGELMSAFPNVPLLIDHLGWHPRGTAAEYDDVLRLAKLPLAYMKVTVLAPESKAVLKRVYDSFGPDRMLWESYGSSMPEFEKILSQIDDVLDFMPERERAKVRGANAMKVYRFTSA